MTKSDISNQNMLVCLRLAAECNNLSEDAAMPNHARVHYFRLASMWMELAVSRPKDVPS